MLQAHQSVEGSIVWLSDDLTQEWTWSRQSRAIRHGSISDKQISMPPSRRRQFVWSLSQAFFLGEWEDSNESIVKVNWKGGSLSAHFNRQGRKSLRLPITVKQGEWRCGKGVLQKDTCNVEQILWISDDSSESWKWHRTHSEYLPHAPFMSEVTHFCMCSVSSMKPSKEAVEVPIWALRFTQYNINENLRFSDGSHMFTLLKELLHDPARIRKLSPLDAFLFEGPDAQKALYCRNNRRLLVLRCVQAVHSDAVLKVMCRINDPHSTQRSCHGKRRLRDWFQDGYSKPGQFSGCDGLGLDIWIREPKG